MLRRRPRRKQECKPLTKEIFELQRIQCALTFRSVVGRPKSTHEESGGIPRDMDSREKRREDITACVSCQYTPAGVLNVDQIVGPCRRISRKYGISNDRRYMQRYRRGQQGRVERDPRWILRKQRRPSIVLLSRRRFHRRHAPLLSVEARGVFSRCPPRWLQEAFGRKVVDKA